MNELQGVVTSFATELSFPFIQNKYISKLRVSLLK